MAHSRMLGKKGNLSNLLILLNTPHLLCSASILVSELIATRKGDCLKRRAWQCTRGPARASVGAAEAPFPGIYMQIYYVRDGEHAFLYSITSIKQDGTKVSSYDNTSSIKFKK